MRWALPVLLFGACGDSAPSGDGSTGSPGSTGTADGSFTTGGRDSSSENPTVSGVAPGLTLQVGDLEGTEDDLVAVGGAVSATLTRVGPAVDVALSAEGPAALTFEPSLLTLTEAAPAIVTISAISASSAENDTRVVATADDAMAEASVTAITGIKIAFAGTFSVAVDNNNGFTTSSRGPPIVCGGDPDPEIWRTTPLPCEGFALDGVVGVAEGEAPTRFEPGVRPTVEVVVTGVKSFGPAVDLAGRDAELDVGTVLRGPVGQLVTDTCDQGVEPLLDFAVDVGDALSLAYADAASPARTWTHFPPLPTPAQEDADRVEVMDVLLPDAETGCSTAGLTYFDSQGDFQCLAEQTVRELLLRNAGFRASIRLAWANWTSRGLVVTSTATSFLGELFAASGGGAAAGFMQLGGFDWYTLVGEVRKGVLATPGGIDPRFVEWNDDCPVPLTPDVAEDEDPY